MNDSGGSRLTGWQRVNVALAAEYLRELASRAPHDDRARAVYAALLEVLEPPRRVARLYRERRGAPEAGSMWDQRSGRDRRAHERRAVQSTPAAGEERRRVQRRSGRDRRVKRA